MGCLFGLLFDCFDMLIEIFLLLKGMLVSGGDCGESIEVVKECVFIVCEWMLVCNGKVNVLFGSWEIECYCLLIKMDVEFLENVLYCLGFLICVYYCIIKVVCMIVDLEGVE